MGRVPTWASTWFETIAGAAKAPAMAAPALSARRRDSPSCDISSSPDQEACTTPCSFGVGRQSVAGKCRNSRPVMPNRQRCLIMVAGDAPTTIAGRGASVDEIASRQVELHDHAGGILAPLRDGGAGTMGLEGGVVLVNFV